VSVDGAVIAGKVVSNVNGMTDYWLEYGTTSSLDSETPRQAIYTPVNTPVSVTVGLSGLERDTVYHYRLCAEDEDAGACGGARVFRTQEVACGETVTTDVMLTGTLDCGPESPGPITGPDGLVVGAAGLEINLGGHTLIGPTGFGVGAVDGIDDSAGHDDLTIRNGQVRGWDRAIRIEGADRAQIRNVEAPAVLVGLEIRGGAGTAIRNSLLAGFLGGLRTVDHDGLAVTGNELRAGSAGTANVDGDDSVFARNVVTGGVLNAGIHVIGSRNRVIANRVSGFGTTGILVAGGSDNVVDGNEISEVRLVDGPPSNGDGIFVAAPAVGTLLRDNYVHENEGDGIEVESAGTRLRGNRADTNDDLGIQAVAGVIDLGGNSASGNANPLQCTNVFCQ